MSSTIVMKFGGTSVATKEAWATIAETVRLRQAEGFRPVLVCSAVATVSNRLEALVRRACQGEHEEEIDGILEVHRALGRALDLDADAILREEFESLRRIALGISLVRDASPKVRAQTLALGEIMSTRLGAVWLERQGIPVHWVDARQILRSDDRHQDHEARHFLQASCAFDPDPELQRALAPHPVVLTQGFIASDGKGRTVLLGRGGSDTSAAYLAARLGARRLEIWTDVPGMFSANPRDVPDARLILRLGYGEAQELASAGARILHPRCIEPARRHGIPIHIKDTRNPSVEGTVIAGDEEHAGTVKAVTMRKGLALVSLDSLGMWQQVGFLARVAALFQNHGISIEHVATTESNITLTFDPAQNAVDEERLESLVKALAAICEVRLVKSCVAISVVGHRVHEALSRLSPALQAFEHENLHLLSHAASGVNLTFVVDEDQAQAILSRLHDLLFDDETDGLATFGPNWAQLSGTEPPPYDADAWWRHRADELVALAAWGTPVYVYDEETLEKAIEELRSLPVDRLFFAMKANANPEVLRVFERAGLGFECVSPGELLLLERLFPGLEPDRILFTPNFAPIEEYRFALERGVHVILDNAFPLRARPDVFAGRSIWLRIDPEHGDGHHAHVRTAGVHSKFGIPREELAELAELARAHDIRVVGLHAHAGSGIFDPENWARVGRFLAALAHRHFPEAKILDVGGGLGVVEHPAQTPLDLDEVGRRLATFRREEPDFRIWMEPGRFLVARAGVLLCRVTQLKQKGDHRYVGVDAGMHTLIRPALYGSYHPIANLTRLGEPLEWRADVVGPICETGDVLGKRRRLPRTEVGDVLAIATAGAYGSTMSSQYNLRTPAKETLLPRRRGDARVAARSG
ncbi:MAG TPA: bifunctional aspartate kinase/diaminopimelate decarboxylase [Fredinandcohnia sp.]|nr:bifunctional aspartate kinase/diaminopimelate decarboxylase [Fredinandcohnia sp.]